VALRYFSPSQRLRAHVSFLYVLDTETDNFSSILPAMLGQVQLKLFGSLDHCHTGAGGTAFDCAPPTMLTGPSHGVTRLFMRDRMLTVGAGLLPLGWARLVRASAMALADATVDARAIWGPAVNQAHARAVEARNDAARVAVLDAFLCGLLDNAPDIDRRIGIVDRWLVASPLAAVDGLSQAIDLSSRQVQRLTAATHGAAPKRLAAKYRTLRAATLLGLRQAGDWRGVADGYADQAHLIRDFRRFVGHSPRALGAGDALDFRNLVAARSTNGASQIGLWS
jgi:AraC-like DNA-binding protein